MKKIRTIVVMLLMMLLMALSASVQAQAATGWVKEAGNYKYYTKSGELCRSKWIKIGKKYFYVNANGNRVTGLVTINSKKYYFDKNGVNKTGWVTINGNKYYFLKSTRNAIVNQIYKFSNGKSYYFDANGINRTGWVKLNGKYYYFKSNMKTGWLTIGTKKYYLIKSKPYTGQRATGVFSISGKLYYFDDENGVLQKNTTVMYGGREYRVDGNGVCTVVPTSKTPTQKMLFFLTFESGSAAYKQTGGDKGKACGAYQFDYRYALLPFVKYAYAKNPSLCKEFKTYASLSVGTSLMGNKKFFKAWETIYNRNPKNFSTLQDNYARINYYDNVERSLASAGIDLTRRPDVVKGAVYSYSIQHGQSAAVAAVKALKIKSTTTSTTFITKLYDYRAKKWPAYKTRYSAEKALALSLLS